MKPRLCRVAGPDSEHAPLRVRLALTFLLCSSLPVFASPCPPLTAGDRADLFLRDGGRVQGTVTSVSRRCAQVQSSRAACSVRFSTIACTRQAQEGEAHFLMRAGAALIGKQNPVAARLLLEALRQGAPADSAGLLLAQAFYERGDLAAALSANVSIDTWDKDLMPQVLHQRIRLLGESGLGEQAAKNLALMRQYFGRSPFIRSDSRFVKHCRDRGPLPAEPSAESGRSRLLPRVTLSSEGYYGRKTVDAAQLSEWEGAPDVPLQDTVERVVRGSGSMRVLWTLAQNGRARVQAGPVLKVKLPAHEAFYERYGGGADALLTVSTGPVAEHEFSLSAYRSVKNGLVPANSVSLGWSGMRLAGNNGFLMAALGGGVDLPQQDEAPTYLAYISAMRYPLLRLGPRLSVRLSASILASLGQDVDMRTTPAALVAGSGFGPGVHMEDSAVLLQGVDGVLSKPAAGDTGGFVVLPSEAIVKTQARTGRVVSGSVAIASLEVGAALSVARWLSLDISAGPSLYRYGTPFVWDNADNACSVIGLQDTAMATALFTLRDGRQFVCDSRSRVFREYVRRQEPRTDLRLSMRAGLRVAPPRLGSVSVYARFRVNRSSLGTANPFLTDYTELSPGVEWRATW